MPTDNWLAPDTVAPEAVVTAAAGATVRPVWRNDAGGLTFELGSGPGRRFAKWAPHGSGLDLHGEEMRLRWAEDFTPVPRVLEIGSDDDGDWLVTAGLPGRSCVDPFWATTDPALAVRAAGAGLRRLHDALPVDDCPFSWSVEDRLAQKDRAGTAPTLQAEVPPIDRLVVCHGDACLPNTLVLDDGTWSGHVDLDALGVADRWADLAVATMSLGWNVGDGWEETFLDAYGIAPDERRTAFYRALWLAG
ncbi:phosphotransferase [Frigoribacterium salinisoli]